MKIETQEISSPIFKEKNIRLFLKRIDQIDNCISGNKWYKLKHNLLAAQNANIDTLLTFGGAYSNHIYSTACIASKNNFHSIGLIRGEEIQETHTLKSAKKHGMRIFHISRQEYSLKNNTSYLQDLSNRFGQFYTIPEGGTNQLGVQGAQEILNSNDQHDFICCAVGTGGTISGLINKATLNQRVIGFSVVNKTSNIEDNINNWVQKNNFELKDRYNFGGYANINDKLIDFIHNFYDIYKIPLDAVYTGKMMMGVFDLISKDFFKKGSSILAIHTGGLQGNIGMNHRFGLNLPIA